MRERFERVWAEGVHRAATWRRGDDPTPVLDAVAQSVVLHLVDALGRVPDDDRRLLEEVVPAALASAREQAEAQPEDRDAWLQAASLAELGLRLLRGEPGGDLARVPGDVRRPTPRRLASMLDGRLHGLSAASSAVWCLRHDPSEARLLWSVGVRLRTDPAGGASSEPPVLVAAAEPAPMRAPEGGRVVAQHTDPDLEAVWFAADRHLALYAADEVYVALSAPGVTTVDLRPGYWLGAVDPECGPSVEAEAKVGDRSVQWRIPLA